jgi:FixJ family two-component response regulator
MRLGVRDMMTKPFDLSHLTSTIKQLLDEQRQQQAKQQRSHRLRTLAGRIVRERRELRQRLDLLCRDFVHAHQRLAEKVVKDRELDDAP